MLAVIYLIFNAGYLAPSGAELVDVDLCAEAVRLCDVVVELLPDESEPLALAAMMRFQDARREARVDAEGVPVTLEEQDRPRWDGVRGGGRTRPARPGPRSRAARSLRAEGVHRRPARGRAPVRT